MGIGKIFVVYAPSGAGKTTLVNAVLKRIGPHRFLSRAITYTTRAPRNDEKDGCDFHYLTVPIFKNYINDGFFLEWSNAHINYYGTPRSLLDGIAQGKSYLLIVDRVGAEQVRAQSEHVVLIWITVPEVSLLKMRLASRGTENPVQIEQRLKRAQEEITLEMDAPLYDHCIVNDNFTAAASHLESIIRGTLDDRSNEN